MTRSLRIKSSESLPISIMTDNFCDCFTMSISRHRVPPTASRVTSAMRSEHDHWAQNTQWFYRREAKGAIAYCVLIHLLCEVYCLFCFLYPGIIIFIFVLFYKCGYWLSASIFIDNIFHVSDLSKKDLVNTQLLTSFRYARCSYIYLVWSVILLTITPFSVQVHEYTNNADRNDTIPVY